jgi:hypothetical protein
MSDPTDGRPRDPAMSSTAGEPVLDGNAAAGALSEIFAVELTAAVAECAGCGRRGALAEAVSYQQAPGLVLRCRGCEHVMVRVVLAPDRRWVDMTGVAVMELSVAAS